jgi:flagellar biosynthetic protein FliP
MISKTNLTVCILLLSAPILGSAADLGLPAVSVVTQPNGEQSYSITLQVLALMTALTFIPAGLLMLTSFTRTIIVLSIVRQAVGMPQAPSSQVLVGLALFLTFFIMSPVFERVYDESVKPYLDEKIEIKPAFEAAKKPFRQFMVAQVRDTDLDMFVRLSNHKDVDSVDDIAFTTLMPAFITSELKSAYQIGFMIFIPFLVIDLVVASILMAMGMMMLSPMIISLPFKIMLFVLVDGWAMIMGTLASSFYV